MMDFGRWFSSQKPHEEKKEALVEEELPDGVWESGPDTYSAKCCMCHQSFELPNGLQSVPKPGQGHDFYCYGSYRCCP